MHARHLPAELQEFVPALSGNGARPDGRVVVADTAPMRLAELYLDTRQRLADGTPMLRRWRGDWFRWQDGGGCYAILDDEALGADLRRYLDRLDVASGEGEKPLRVTNTMVREVERALPALDLLVDGEAPRWLSGDGASPDELLVAPNGLYHLPTGELQPATPRYFATAALGAPVLPDCGEPKAWIEFLHSLWPDDMESIVALQEFAGYVLTGDARLHKALLIVGPPRSGKGTIARTLTALLGAANVAGPTLAALGERFGLAPLVGRRLAIVSDARLSGRSDQAQIVERLLSVTGEDALTIDRKNRESVTTRLGTRFMILSNELPRLADASGALPSRFVVLVLRESFLGREKTDLEARLTAELSAILGWAIEGWRRLHRRGRFVQPGAGAEAVEDFGRLGSPIRAFLADECDVVAGAEIDVTELYEAWRRWCTKQGRDRSGDQQALARGLRSALPFLATCQRRLPNGNRVRVFSGVRLKG